MGPAFAGEIFKNFTIGMSLFLVYHVDKYIDNQLVLYNRDSSNKERYYFQETSSSKTNYSALPKIGIQWMPISNISLGAVVSKKFVSWSSKTTKLVNNTLSGTAPADPTGNLSEDLNKTITHDSGRDLSPIEIGLGVAYYPNKKFLLSSDLYYYLADPDFKGFKNIDVWNLSIGSELFLSEASAVRAGVFTDNANTASVGGGKNQPANVNMYGLSLSYSFVSSGSSFTLGMIYSKGDGRGQVIGDSTSVQDIQKISTTAYLTGSYQM